MSFILPPVSDPRAREILLTHLEGMFGLLSNAGVPVSYAVPLMTDKFWDAEMIVTKFLCPWLKEFSAEAYLDFKDLTESSQNAFLRGEYDWSSGESVLDLFMLMRALNSRLRVKLPANINVVSSGVRFTKLPFLVYRSSDDEKIVKGRCVELCNLLRASLTGDSVSASGEREMFEGHAYHFSYTLLYALAFYSRADEFHGFMAKYDDNIALTHFDHVLGVYANVVNKYRVLKPDSMVLERLGQL